MQFGWGGFHVEWFVSVKWLDMQYRETRDNCAEITLDLELVWTSISLANEELKSQ